ncbi:TlpA disulfide reductase family protein [Flavobacterium sp. SUN052]|uniref:TlpA disulfide reductase family protein n=1 Tax=Flavobacterium sp. SUN052 TaxID=3002441 RepID=UPI00237EE567|nr:TlpA disulfide reductase family protein [Flavobacterium sp. SUN052]MEC4005867.1 TlpA disulfide reductase family protein [Flavobacterium sp. SUN052]
MKKIVVLIVLSLTIFSCTNVPKGEFLISGAAKGLPDGKMITLKVRNEFGQIVNMDSAKVKDGKFTIKGKVKEPNMLAIFIQGTQQPIPFILETGAIDITIDKDSIWKSEIGGTHNNDVFQEFNTKLNGFNKRLVAFQNKNMAKAMEFQKKQNKVGLEGLNKEYSAIQKEMNDYMSKFPEENTDAYISLVILESKFSAQDFNLENIKKTFNAIDSDLKATKIGKAIQEKLNTIEKNNKIKPETALVGKLAPDFSAKNPEGQEISLKQSLGKVTIIDFWASWCGPCRAENPNVVAIYNEFHSKGLNIIGVSLDDDLNNWKDAIAKDKITWTQVSNLKKWKDPIAAIYGVEAIPATFILDSNGIVVVKDLRGEELKAKIKELLGVK